MNSKRWQQIKDLLAQVRDLAPAEREHLLEEHCQGDPDLLLEVRRLLDNEGGLEGFLEPPAREDLVESLRSLSFNYVGCKLGDYHLLRELGRGATGVVYLARQLSLERNVALKILAPQLSFSEKRLERFRREALAESKLRHPNIVSVLFFGDHEGVPYLAMEYVEGKSLREHVARAKERKLEGLVASAGAVDVSDPRTAAELVAKVAAALDHCHAEGIIHRDIKPNNIILDERGEPRIVDFGLARDEKLESLTETGEIYGTPYYMSPEQAMALGSDVDHRTDIYSLGAVLYELLTLEHPFTGSTSMAVLDSIKNGQPRPIQKHNPQVPLALVRICQKAMEKRPEDRYQSGEEMAADLRAFIAGKRVRARPVSWQKRVRDILARRSKVLALASGLVLLSLFVGARLNHSSVFAHDSEAQRNADSRLLLKYGIPADAFDRLSPDEQSERIRLYKLYLQDALPDTLPVPRESPH